MVIQYDKSDLIDLKVIWLRSVHLEKVNIQST